jgi:hypothetical protein
MPPVLKAPFEICFNHLFLRMDVPSELRVLQMTAVQVAGENEPGDNHLSLQVTWLVFCR